MTPRPMTADELAHHARKVEIIRSCLSALRLTADGSEDVGVAKARLENWLTENDGRWVTTRRPTMEG